MKQKRWTVISQNGSHFAALYDGDHRERVHPISFTDKRDADRAAVRLNAVLNR